MKIELKLVIDHKDLGDAYLALLPIKKYEWQTNPVADTKQKTLPAPHEGTHRARRALQAGTLTSAVQKIVEEAGRISRADIILCLKKHKIRTTSVGTALASLVDQGRIERVAGGTYGKVS
jgi:hypothetical protein